MLNRKEFLRRRFGLEDHQAQRFLQQRREIFQLKELIKQKDEYTANLQRDVYAYREVVGSQRERIQSISEDLYQIKFKLSLTQAELLKREDPRWALKRLWEVFKS